MTTPIFPTTTSWQGSTHKPPMAIGSKIMVIGAGGRIGLPFSVHLAKTLSAQGQSTKVIGVELYPDYVEQLNLGMVPFKEDDMDDLLPLTVLKRKSLSFVTYKSNEFSNEFIDPECTDIMICVGSPADEKKGVLDHRALFDFFTYINNTFTANVISGKRFAIRSTVEPGITDRIYHQYDTDPVYKSIPKPLVYYWPERVMEGVAIKEFKTLPNIIGIPEAAFSDILRLPQSLFGDYKTVLAKEAEFMKVAGNLVRYVEFALANELFLAAQHYGVNFLKIRNVMTDKYDRLNSLKRVGLNVGGPCLSKDHLAFSDYTKFGTNNKNSLFNQADMVNKIGIIEWLGNRIDLHVKQANKARLNILILGISFKAESDDVRGSRTYEIEEFLNDQGHDVTLYDPVIYGENASLLQKASKFDVIVVSTPHEIFHQKTIFQLKDQCLPETLVIDLWGIFAKPDFTTFGPTPSGYVGPIGEL